MYLLKADKNMGLIETGDNLHIYLLHPKGFRIPRSAEDGITSAYLRTDGLKLNSTFLFSGVHLGHS